MHAYMHEVGVQSKAECRHAGTCMYIRMRCTEQGRVQACRYMHVRILTSLCTNCCWGEVHACEYIAGWQVHAHMYTCIYSNIPGLVYGVAPTMHTLYIYMWSYACTTCTRTCIYSAMYIYIYMYIHIYIHTHLHILGLVRRRPDLCSTHNQCTHLSWCIGCMHMGEMHMHRVRVALFIAPKR